MREMNRQLPDRANLEELYALREPIYEEILLFIVKKMKQVLVGTDINATIKYRVKSFESYFKKLLHRLQNGDTSDPYAIHDVLGIKIICPFLSDLEIIEKLVAGDFEISEVERKGVDQSFREFGYKSTHLLIKIPPGVISIGTVENTDYCEVQLLTTLQDAWSEVEHELVYKAEYSTYDLPLKRKLAALNANLTLADIIFQEIRDYHKEMENELKIRRNRLYERIKIVDEADSAGTSMGDGNPGKTMPQAAHREFDDTLDSVLLRAISAHNDGRFETAIELYSQMLNSGIADGIMSVIYNHRGLAYFARSEYGNAVEDFTMAVKCDNHGFRAFNYRGMANRMLGEYGRALADLDESIRINPYQPESYYSRSLVHYDLGDMGRSMEDCEKALNLDPRNDNYKKFLKLIKNKIFQ